MGKVGLYGGMCRIKCPIFQLLMKKVLSFISPVIYERNLTDLARSTTLKALSATEKHSRITLMLCLLLASRSSRSIVRQETIKRARDISSLITSSMDTRWKSPSGLELGSPLHQPEYVSDIIMFREAFDWHEDASAKDPGYIVVSYHGPLLSQFPMKCAIIGQWLLVISNLSAVNSAMHFFHYRRILLPIQPIHEDLFIFAAKQSCFAIGSGG